MSQINRFYCEDDNEKTNSHLVIIIVLRKNQRKVTIYLYIQHN